MATIIVITLRPLKEYTLQSNGMVHIARARSPLEAMRKGREWFNTTSVRIIRSK